MFHKTLYIILIPKTRDFKRMRILLLILIVSTCHAESMKVEISVVLPVDSKFMEIMSQQYPNTTFQVFPIICILGVDCYNDTNVTRRSTTTRSEYESSTGGYEFFVACAVFFVGTAFIFILLLKKSQPKRIIQIPKHQLLDIPIKPPRHQLLNVSLRQLNISLRPLPHPHISQPLPHPHISQPLPHPHISQKNKESYIMGSAPPVRPETRHEQRHSFTARLPPLLPRQELRRDWPRKLPPSFMQMQGGRRSVGIGDELRHHQSSIDDSRITSVGSADPAAAPCYITPALQGDNGGCPTANPHVRGLYYLLPKRSSLQYLHRPDPPSEERPIRPRPRQVQPFFSDAMVLQQTGVRCPILCQSMDGKTGYEGGDQFQGHVRNFHC
jgi:hypothetical protein